jgi:HAD superfamily hydrolase (TIGR01484 family)
LQPLNLLEPARCRDLVGVVFDIDDTLTDHGLLTDRAYQALCRLGEEGLTLVAVTGRPLGWCDVLARLWPVAVAIGENGGGWVARRGRGTHEGYWDGEATRREQHAALDALARRAQEAIRGLRLASDQRHRRVDLAFDVGEECRLADGEITALCELIHAAGARSLVSSVHAHAFFGAHDKASGAARALQDVLARDLGAEKERWLFLGDSGNDAAAFAYFPLSVGVANVRPHLSRLPVAPAFVAEGERGAGFAEIAAHVLAARKAV